MPRASTTRRTSPPSSPTARPPKPPRWRSRFGERPRCSARMDKGATLNPRVGEKTTYVVAFSPSPLLGDGHDRLHALSRRSDSRARPGLWHAESWQRQSPLSGVAPVADADADADRACDDDAGYAQLFLAGSHDHHLEFFERRRPERDRRDHNRAWGHGRAGGHLVLHLARFAAPRTTAPRRGCHRGRRRTLAKRLQGPA